ncbi:MAG: metallophosphoesterase [Tepidisphaerales bacterium]
MRFVLDFLQHPEWKRQHGWRKAIFDAMARLGLTGMHGLPLNRRWIEIHRRNMPLRGLAPSLDGLKIVQISDLHYSPVVWRRYLMQFMHWVNDLEPDIVVVTGDLITGGYKYARGVARLLSHIRATHPVICTLGNHDYSMIGKHHPREGRRRADFLEKCLQDSGHIVLRNQAWRLAAPGGGLPLTIVGLDDEWTGSIDPDAAYAGVNPADPIICLNHNPANCLELMQYPWQWMLSGHTHGRQLATNAVGRRLYPHKRRRYTHGYYCVAGRNLYVNRGLSYGQRRHHWCRPEITVFTLNPEP